MRNTISRAPRPRPRAGSIAAGLAVAALVLAACGDSDDTNDDNAGNDANNAEANGDNSADSDSDNDTATGDDAGTVTAPEGSGEVVLVTHESFTLPDEVLEEFTTQTGYTVTVQAVGDAGAMANQLVLTAGSPLGDAVFGVDNTFASRVVSEGVLAPYSPELPEGGGEHALDGDAAEHLTPISYGDVCLNIDDVWFEDNGIEPPTSLQDLTDEAYADLFVTPGATDSSPGLAFLLATIGEFGEDGWQDYWSALMDNGALITSGWSDAYYVDFTAGGGDGDRPIVLSYASSPPFTIPDGEEEPTTSALLDTCFRQVEYAGVIEGAENVEGAEALIDFLLSDEVQAEIPDAMFVYPVSTQVELPELWAQWADVADAPIEISPEEIEANREAWVMEWADVTAG